MINRTEIYFIGKIIIITNFAIASVTIVTLAYLNISETFENAIWAVFMELFLIILSNLFLVCYLNIKRKLIFNNAKRAYFNFLTNYSNDLVQNQLFFNSDIKLRGIRLLDIYEPLILALTGESENNNPFQQEHGIIFGDADHVVDVQGNVLWINPNRHSIEEIIKDHQYISILSPPGSGKSYLIKKLILDYIKTDKGVFPLFIRCSRISGMMFNTFREILESLVKTSDIIFNTENSTLFIEEVLKLKEIILLIDGVDEISKKKDRIKFISTLMNFMKSFPEAKIITTSRLPGYRIIFNEVMDDFTFFKIVKIRKNTIEKIVKKWSKLLYLNNDDSSQFTINFKQNLDRNDRLYELAGNPLLLLIMIALEFKEITIPEKRNYLYEKIVDVLISSWNIEGCSKMKPNPIKLILSYIAYKMLKKGKSSLYHDELMEILIKSQSLLISKFRFPIIDMEELINKIEYRTSIFTCLGNEIHKGREMKIFGFLHRQFQEYFGALALCYKMFSDDVIKKNIQHIDNKDWVESIPLLSAMIEEKAETLIESIYDHITKNEKELENKVIFEFPPTKILIQCIIDTSGLTDNLVQKSIRLILKHVFINKNKYEYLGLFQFNESYYSEIFISILEESLFEYSNYYHIDLLLSFSYHTKFEQNEGELELDKIIELIDSNDNVQINRGIIFLKELIQFHNKKINQENDKQKIQDISSLLMNMITTGKDITIKISAIRALRHLLEENLWNPKSPLELFQILITMWLDSNNDDHKYFICITISKFPLNTLEGAILKRSSLIEKAVKNVLEINPDDIDISRLFMSEYVACLYLAYLYEIYNSDIIVDYIKKFLKVQNVYPPPKTRDKNIYLIRYKPLFPLLKKLGEPAKELLFIYSKLGFK